METQSDSSVERVTIDEVLSLATWNRERTDEELQGFIESHYSAIGDVALNSVTI